ncbi:MAG: hypothetical protein HN405_08865 [Planctomycetes bacterium]|jgi:hypothetical protein|nr:hypothetical protein [Planctomycetota bacterium]MBT4028485.1 hypothetical protein [Planctomycetota bacterium]MBT7319096.1 hypothetical protein [Planctomycetota bacterium]
MVASLAALAGGAWGVMEYLKDSKEQNTDSLASTTEAVVETTTPVTPEAAPLKESPAAVLAETTTATTPLAETTPGSSDSTDEAVSKDAEKPSAPVTPDVAFEAPEAGLPINYKGITDPNKLDLKAVSLLPQWSNCDDETWASVKEDIALFLDDSGLQSNRAGDRLIADSPREAFPAIVNAMLQGDYFSREGLRTVGALNDLLTKMGKGQNFGWESIGQHKFGSEGANKAIMFNKKIACIWHNMWVGKLSKDENQWRAFTKTKDEVKKVEDPMEQAPNYDDDPFDD